MINGIGTERQMPWKAGLAALILSVLAHIGLFRLNPDLFMGTGSAPFQTSRSAPSPPVVLDQLRLEESRRELPLLLDQFGLLQEQTPAPQETLEPPLPDTHSFDALPAESLAGEVEAAAPETAVPELPEPLSDWMPREEVLALSEQRMIDPLAALPRTLRDSASETPPHADVLPPIDYFADAPPVAAVLTLPAPPAPPDVGMGGRPGLPLRAGPPAGGPDLSDLPLLTPPSLIRETPEERRELTELEPVDTLLRLSSQSYIDPARPEYRYFKIQLLPAGLDKLPVLPRQVVFLLDCSASMTQPMLREAVQGIDNALNTLSPQDTVNLIAFRDEVDILFPESPAADRVGVAAVRGKLAQLRAFGRTDVFASLEALKSLPEQPDRTRVAILVTDGIPTLGLTDSSEIIENFTRVNQGRISFFSVGGGRQVNRYLIDFLSFRNRGDSLVAERNVQLPAAVERMASEIRRPVMTDLSYQFTGAGGLAVYPKSLTHLYLDRPLILVGRAPVSQRQIAFQIVGRSAEGSHDMLYTLDLTGLPPGPWSLRQEWAWQALLDLVGRHLSSPGAEIMRQLQEISTTYRIPLPYADILELP